MHDVRHIMTAAEVWNELDKAADEGHRSSGLILANLPVKLCTGPGKHQTHLISSIYYSPETQTIWIDTEN